MFSASTELASHSSIVTPIRISYDDANIGGAYNLQGSSHARRVVSLDPTLCGDVTPPLRAKVVLQSNIFVRSTFVLMRPHFVRESERDSAANPNFKRP